MIGAGASSEINGGDEERYTAVPFSSEYIDEPRCLRGLLSLNATGGTLTVVGGMNVAGLSFFSIEPRFSRSLSPILVKMTGAKSMPSSASDTWTRHRYIL